MQKTNEVKLMKHSILDVQENYNQFVWVPLPTFYEFVRHDFGTQNISDSDFINTDPTNNKYYEPTANGVANTTEVKKFPINIVLSQFML